MPRTIFKLAVCLTAALAGAQPARASIIGEDERTEVPERYRSLAAGIGLLYNSPAGYACTAFCVAPDTIATSAHCLVRRRGPDGPVRLGDMRFSPTGPFVAADGRETSLRHVADDQPRLSFYAGASRGGASLAQQAGDWAFAKIDSHVCRHRALPFAEMAPDEIARQAKQSRLFMIGYHGDRMLVEKWLSPDCKVRSAGDRTHFLPSQRRSLRRAGVLLAHTCDMTEGASGSPIFLDGEGGPAVVAINSGGVGFSEYRLQADGRSRRLVASRETNLSVLASAFLPGLERFAREHLLAGLDDFRDLQRLLKRKGTYRGPVDGLMGPGTARALAAREKELGLPPLGMPTRELLEGLRAELDSPAPPEL